MQPSTIGNIVYVISAYSGDSTGIGGHYFSVKDISTEIHNSGAFGKVTILALGNIFPKPLVNSDVPVIHVTTQGRSIWLYCRDVMEALDRLEPDIIHAFDNKSFLFGRLYSRRRPVKCVLTKPGGPNPGPNFPKADCIICFSQENYNHLRSQKKLKHSSIYLVPNRVPIPQQNEAKIAELRASCPGEHVLLRICRIGEYYKRSLMQTLNLGNTIRQEGQRVSVLIVGVVESADVLALLQAHAHPDDRIVTSQVYSGRASEIIGVADVVVGTGRSLIEAAMIGKPVLCPDAKKSRPVLLTMNNVDAYAVNNFSERSSHVEPNDPSLTSYIIKDINKASYGLSPYMISNYSTGPIPTLYKEIYALADYKKSHMGIDIALNSLSFLRAYFRATRAGK